MRDNFDCEGNMTDSSDEQSAKRMRHRIPTDAGRRIGVTPAQENARAWISNSREFGAKQTDSSNEQYTKE
jgi:hypothetical protein